MPPQNRTAPASGNCQAVCTAAFRIRKSRRAHTAQSSLGKPVAAKQTRTYASSLLSALAPVSRIPLRYSLTAQAGTAKPLKRAQKSTSHQLRIPAVAPTHAFIHRKTLGSKADTPPPSVCAKAALSRSLHSPHRRFSPAPCAGKTSSLRRKSFCRAAPECHAFRTQQTRSARRRSAPQSHPAPSAA